MDNLLLVPIIFPMKSGIYVVNLLSVKNVWEYRKTGFMEDAEPVAVQLYLYLKIQPDPTSD